MMSDHDDMMGDMTNRRDTTEIGVNVVVTVRDAETGDVVETHEEHNLVTLAGRNLVRDLLNEATDTGLNYFAIGTGTTAAAEGDTALGAEVIRDVFTARSATDGVLTISFFLSSASANGSALTEAGIFTQSTAGVLFARAVHPAINKTSSVTVTYTWAITIGAV